MIAAQLHLPIDAEELAWARECLARGDVSSEVARWSGRATAEWLDAFNEHLPSRDPNMLSARMQDVRWAVLNDKPLEEIARLAQVSPTRANQLVSQLLGLGYLKRTRDELIADIDARGFGHHLPTSPRRAS